MSKADVSRSAPVLILWLIFVVLHGWLFVVNRSWAVLGYDTGFYRRYIIEPLTSIPHAAVPGLDHTVIIPRIALDLFRLLPIQTDAVLYGSYTLAAVFLGWAFYLWVAEIFGRKVALISYGVVLLSPVYFHAYWFFLFKNFLALGLFFLLLLALRRHMNILVLILSLVLPVTHQSTTIVAILALLTLVVLAKFKTEDWYTPLSSAGIMTLVYVWFHPAVAAKLNAPPTAIFLDWQVFVFYTWPVLLAAGISMIRAGKVFLRQTDLVSLGAVITIFTACMLPYYERLFLWLLFILAIITAYELAKMSKRNIAIVLILLGLWNVYQLKEYEPLISDDIANNLMSLQSLEMNSSVILPNYLAPWAHGYTLAEVYAPGVFKDRFKPVDWNMYWLHAIPEYDQAFLDSFPQPLYLFVPPNNLHFLPLNDCAQLVKGYLYRYSCYNRNQ